MKFVQRIVRPDGQVQLYLRKKGLPSIRLKSPEDSPALAAEIEALIASLTPQPLKPGTLAKALRYYELESPDFRNLAPSTRYEYRLILKELDGAAGDMPVASFTPALILRMRDAWAKSGHRAANVRMHVLRNVLRPALVANGITSDPFSLVGDVRRPAEAPEPHVLWPASALKVVLEAAIAERRFGLARAIAIARYVGARRGDLVKLPRTARHGGRIVFLSGKRKVPVDQIEDPELTRWLDATPATQPLTPWQMAEDRRRGVTRLPATTLVYNRAGARYTEDGLGQELAKLIANLAKNGALTSSAYDFHGLRHTRGVEAALAGCTDAQGAALLGHSSPSSFVQYRRQADRIRMAEDAQAKITALRIAAPEQVANAKCNEECNGGVTSA